MLPADPTLISYFPSAELEGVPDPTQPSNGSCRLAVKEEGLVEGIF
jgi:hypothetical protein